VSVLIGIQIDVSDTMIGQALVRVSNQETVQQIGPLVDPGLVTSAIERLVEDVRSRATEQAEQCFRRIP